LVSKEEFGGLGRIPDLQAARGPCGQTTYNLIMVHAKGSVTGSFGE
jgi:hypothetical protein